MSQVEYRYDEDGIAMHLPIEQDGLLSIETVQQALIAMLSYLPPDVHRGRLTFALEDAFFKVMEPKYRREEVR